MPSATPLAILCQTASFIKSASQVDQCPADQGLEVAFAGRSNAGKSSALNTLTHARLARTSKTPGRTQLINFFGLDEHRRLVDLPGYGYAKVPVAVRRQWGEAMAQYFAERRSLVGVVVLMDIRHPGKELDLQMLDYAAARGLPVLALLTKADKLSFGQAKQTVSRLERELPLPNGRWMAFSGTKGTNVRKVREVIAGWLTTVESAVK